MTVISNLNQARDSNISKAKDIQGRLEKLFYELNVANAQGNTAMAKKIQAEIDVNGQMLKVLTEEMKKITSQLLAETKVFTARVEKRNETIKSLKTAIGIIGGIGIISFFAVFGGFEYGFVVFFGALIICAPLGFYMSRLGLNNIDDLHRASGKDESLVSALRNKLEAEIKLSSSISDMESSANKLKNATTYEDKVKHEAEYKKAQANLERSKLNLNDASQLVSASQPMASPVDELRFMPELYASSVKIEVDDFLDKDLTNDAYKIYLVKKYEIEKNDALGKIILNNKLFNTIEEALRAAHDFDLSLKQEESKSLNLSDSNVLSANNLIPATASNTPEDISNSNSLFKSELEQLGIVFAEGKYFFGNFSFDKPEDAIDHAKREKGGASSFPNLEQPKTNQSNFNSGPYFGIAAILLIVVLFFFLINPANKTSNVTKGGAIVPKDQGQNFPNPPVANKNLSSASKSLDQQPPIQQPKNETPVSREILEANGLAVNQQIDQIIKVRQEWFASKNYSFASKAPISTRTITSAQMSDTSYPTAIEASEMKEWIDYRQAGYRKISSLMTQYEPLSNLMRESIAINREMANKYASSTYELINGKLTYGQFNTIRKNDGFWYDNTRDALDAKYGIDTKTK